MIGQNIKLKFAAFWRRAVAFALDVALVIALYSLLIYGLNSLLDLPVEYSPLSERGLSLQMSPFVEEHFIWIVLLYSVIKLAVLFSYFALLESSRWQATLGKLLLRIRVTDLSWDRISFARATARFFAKVLSGQFLLIGYFLAAFTGRKQALHDLLAGTLVLENENLVAVKTKDR